MQATVVERTLDNLVPKQCKQAPAHEEWPRVAVPVNTGSATRVIYRALWLGRELSNFLQVQRFIAYEQNLC
jgi:hypothetical protein